MLSTYIPGFTNMLMQPEYIGGPARVNRPLGVQPSAPAIMAAPAAAPIMAAPAPAAVAPSAPYIPAVTPRLREASYTPRDMQNAGYLDERTMEPSEEFRRADPSFTRKISDSNTYYTDPATGFFYNPDASRVGQYFTTNRGGAATAKGASGFAEFNPNFEYRLVDKASGNVVYSGMGAEGLTGVQGAAQRFAQEQGDKGDWAVEQFNPATGQATTVARDTKPSNIAGLIADIALPIAAGFIPGVGPVLGAALGSAASSVAQGRSLTDTLLRAGLSAGGAYAGGQALGALGTPAASSTGGLLATGGVLPTVGGGFSATLGGGVGSAVGSGLGSVASQAAQAVAPEIIVSGALNAAGAGLGSTVGAGLGSAAGSALGAAATGGGQAPAPRPAQPAQPRPPVEITPEGNLILTGTPTGGALPAVNPLPIATAGAGALAQAGYNALPDSVKQQIEQKQAEQQAEQEGLIEVTADRVTPPSPLEQAAIAAASATPNLVYGGPEGQLSEIIAERTTPVEQPSQEIPLSVPVSTDPNLVYGGPEGQLSEIISEKQRPTDEFEETFASIPTANVGALNIPEKGLTYDDAGNLTEIVAEGTPPPKEQLPVEALLPGSIAPVLPDLTKTPVDVQGPEKSLLDKLKENLSVTDYLRLAGLGIGLLGGGGGGQGALGTIPSGLFGGSGVFGGSLPRPTLPGASTGFAPRDPATLRPQTTQDWYRYGYGPEQSFFSYVPEGAANTSQAYTGYEQAQEQEEPQGLYLGGMAGGGMRGPARNSFAVNGPGTGRSDEIPAMLSDGEYVIDAETVALLGDGSSKAGADRLDEFRANVRKHKGRHLAKGDFSVNAKRPEKYLKGGRT